LTKIKNKMKQYSNFEEALKNPEEVETLILKNEDLKRKYFLSEIILFVNLKKLDMSFNIHFFPYPNFFTEIKYLKNLEELNIGYNKILSLPVEIGNLNSLKSLNLEALKIQEVPIGLSKLESLEVLKIGSNPRLDIIQFFRVVPTLNNLGFLDLKHNNIKKLSNGITSLKKLKILLLRNNYLDNDVFETLKQITSIEKIDLRWNDAEFSSKNALILSEMKNLKLVMLYGNNIKNKEKEKIKFVLGNIVKI